MPFLGNTSETPAGNTGFAPGFDISRIVTRVSSTKEARALPKGCVVGDMHGGLTFTDAVAAALEARSVGGWQDIDLPTGQRWTIIVLNR
jgi:hypothetical protein